MKRKGWIFVDSRRENPNFLMIMLWSCGEEREPIPADDCEALIDDPNDELVEEVEENDVGGIQVEEQASEVLSTHFGDITTWITRWLMLCFL
ncbi:hypothetical protein Bca52824_069197 [Brassica carinata]|uniref:Uncharacterized protein n=1 Tax=Brassica carinata TaxID=52824 RepID=A0A8X7Q328_BRACI|nr:hypothetical protein Bca52824_069197 [Brassica carinata]